MGLGSAPSGGALTGTTTAVTSGGVATFGQLMVSPAGTYTLVASVPGGAAATSTPFKASQSLVACSDNVFCTASASTTGTVPGSAPAIPYTNTVAVDAPDNSGVNADGGTLAVSFDVGPNVVNCAGYGPASPDREVIDGVNREKTVTSVVAKALLVATGRTAASLKTCLLAPYQFNLGLPLIGGVATPVGDPDGDGVPDFLGVLPKCLQILPPLLGIPILIAAPCQISATADAQGNGVVRYLLKADPHDPAARH
jgi:hypothetical protein